MMTGLIFFLLLLGIFLAARHYKKPSQVAVISSLVLFFISGYGILPALLLHAVETPEPFLTDPLWGKKNAIILLSAGTVLQPETDIVLPSSKAYSRIYEATRLYEACKKNNRLCTVITTGADVMGTGKTEGEVYKKALVDAGVNPADVLVESASHNTFENAEFTVPLLKKMGADQAFLVTSDIHMKRAGMFFTYFGETLIPAASEHAEPYVSLLPSAYNIYLGDAALHEYVGIAQFYLYNLLGLNDSPHAEVAP